MRTCEAAWVRTSATPRGQVAEGGGVRVLRIEPRGGRAGGLSAQARPPPCAAAII